MRYKKFDDHIVAIMETGESILEGLTELCEKEQVELILLNLQSSMAHHFMLWTKT